MAFKQAVRLAHAILHGKGARQFEGIKAMQIAPSGQHIHGTKQVTTRCRHNVAAIKRAQHRRNFVILGKQSIKARAVRAFCDARRIQHILALRCIWRLTHYMQPMRDQRVFQFQKAGAEFHDFHRRIGPGGFFRR